MNAIIFDTETTGLAAPEVIEAAWMPVQFHPDAQGAGRLRWGEPTVRRYRPAIPITMGAMAVHHIMDEDLVGQPPSSSFRLPEGIGYLIGHNVDFDWNVAGAPAHVRRIDTLVLARALWPQCDSYSLGALIYFLHRSTARGDLQSAHSAETDIRLTGQLLEAILQQSNQEVTDFETLWQLSEAARIPTVMPFGKHKGEPIAQVPADYKAWLRRQDNVDPYLLKALSG